MNKNTRDRLTNLWGNMKQESTQILDALNHMALTESLGGDGDDFVPDDDVTTVENLMKELGEIMVKLGIYV